MVLKRHFHKLNLFLNFSLGNDSELGKGKKDSRPDSAENKPKFISTRKYFHKDEDFYVMDAKSIGKSLLNANSTSAGFGFFCKIFT